MLGRTHLQLFVTVDDRPRFEQDRGHIGVPKHEQLVIAVDAYLCVDQESLAMAHEPLRVVRCVTQSAIFQLLAEHSGKQQTAGEIAVVVRDKNGMATEAIAVAALHTLELPGFQKLVRYGVVMDRQKKIRTQRVGTFDALAQSWP